MFTEKQAPINSGRFTPDYTDMPNTVILFRSVSQEFSKAYFQVIGHGIAALNIRFLFIRK